MSGLVQWPQGFENVYSSARQIVPRRGQLNPTKFALRKLLATMMIAYYEFRNHFTTLILCNELSAGPLTGNPNSFIATQ